MCKIRININNGTVIKVDANQAQAGSLESSDILITLTCTGEKGNRINLTGELETHFGEDIRAQIETTLRELKVTGVTIYAEDNGALDCTVVARVEAAVMRARKAGVLS